MKTLFLSFALAISASILFSGCNNDDDMTQIDQEFLTAFVDGEEFVVDGSKTLLECQKMVTEFGSINLSVKVETEEGKTIEFLVFNYYGPGIYPIGNNPLNGSWMKYTEPVPEGFWSTRNNMMGSDIDFLEITQDDGSYLSGGFSFVAFDDIGTSLRTVSDGSFKIKIDK